ncbi:hypothetical protein [Mucilaginibacter sp.]|uniref:hypothetical protein n=1 Tax=Mucilaginibacter sp. TaxID=1882438 RepID=UPI00285007FD|nr:hypothetical protein [Mucilaginibacter sp.]MDR3693467.1 hypothetical protein [Mucilaginibacter sp.]
MYTDEFLKGLIDCPKKIVDHPKEKEGRADFLKKSFGLISINEEYRFNGFITQSLVFDENFSIGLVFNPKDEKGTITLLRCNGRHGGTKEFPHHAEWHIHYADAEMINLGLKPEGRIITTNEYSTLDSAIQFYIQHINLMPEDRQKYFPPPSGQLDLF